MKRASGPAPGSASLDERIALVERATSHTFRDRNLVARAITHPSAVEDRDPDLYYERLEFLGDSVLGLIIAEEIFRRFPSMPEGGLTRIKVSVVSGTVLAAVAREQGLADVIVFGDSERGTGGRGLSSALENVYEAIVGALFIDGSMRAARRWVLGTLGPRIAEDAAETPENPKSALQEFTQAHGEAPTYRVTGQDGPPHDRTFTAVVEVGGKVLGEGRGHSKKEAEALAAKAALERLAKRRRRRRS
jgi:ribonuclease-3